MLKFNQNPVFLDNFPTFHEFRKTENELPVCWLKSWRINISYYIAIQ